MGIFFEFYFHLVTQYPFHSPSHQHCSFLPLILINLSSSICCFISQLFKSHHQHPNWLLKLNLKPHSHFPARKLTQISLLFQPKSYSKLNWLIDLCQYSQHEVCSLFNYKFSNPLSAFLRRFSHLYSSCISMIIFHQTNLIINFHISWLSLLYPMIHPFNRSSQFHHFFRPWSDFLTILLYSYFLLFHIIICSYYPFHNSTLSLTSKLQHIDSPLQLIAFLTQPQQQYPKICHRITRKICQYCNPWSFKRLWLENKHDDCRYGQSNPTINSCCIKIDQKSYR